MGNKLCVLCGVSVRGKDIRERGWGGAGERVCERERIWSVGVKKVWGVV